jgi:hypothetical protein
VSLSSSLLLVELVRAATVENRQKVFPFLDDQEDEEIRCLVLTQTALPQAREKEGESDVEEEEEPS